MLDSSAAAITKDADFEPSRPRLAMCAPRSDWQAVGPEPKKGLSGRLDEAATDQELGQALIERHPAALPLAWRRYYSMVFRMLKRGLGPDSDVEDLAQDVFLGLFKRAHKLRDAEAVRPFILGIARHTLCRERRRKLRRHRLALKFGHQSLEHLTVEGDPAGRYAVVKLSDLLQRLTSQERSSFVLRFGYGLTVAEVAEALRVSEPTAKRRLSRARACLGAWAANNPLLLSYLRRQNTTAVFV